MRLVSKNKHSNLGIQAIKYEESAGIDKSVLEITFTDAECARAERGAIKALEVLGNTEGKDTICFISALLWM